MDGPGSGYLLLRIDRSLVFPAANHVRNIINKAGLGQGRSYIPVVVDCGHVFTADFTGAKSFAAMAEDFGRRNQAIFFTNVKQTVESVFLGSANELILVRSEAELRERILGTGIHSYIIRNMKVLILEWYIMDYGVSSSTIVRQLLFNI